VDFKHGINTESLFAFASICLGFFLGFFFLFGFFFVMLTN